MEGQNQNRGVDSVSPYLDQPLRTLEEVLRQRAAGETAMRGERGRAERLAALSAAVRRPTRDEPFVWRWTIGFSLYSR